MVVSLPCEWQHILLFLYSSAPYFFVVVVVVIVVAADVVIRRKQISINFRFASHFSFLFFSFGNMQAFAFGSFIAHKRKILMWEMGNNSSAHTLCPVLQSFLPLCTVMSMDLTMLMTMMRFIPSMRHALCAETSHFSVCRSIVRLDSDSANRRKRRHTKRPTINKWHICTQNTCSKI